jgi:hypothetical protein
MSGRNNMGDEVCPPGLTNILNKHERQLEDIKASIKDALRREERTGALLKAQQEEDKQAISKAKEREEEDAREQAALLELATSQKTQKKAMLKEVSEEAKQTIRAQFEATRSSINEQPSSLENDQVSHLFVDLGLLFMYMHTCRRLLRAIPSRMKGCSMRTTN